MQSAIRGLGLIRFVRWNLTSAEQGMVPAGQTLLFSRSGQRFRGKTGHGSAVNLHNVRFHNSEINVYHTNKGQYFLGSPRRIRYSRSESDL